MARPKRKAVMLDEETHRIARRLAAERDGNPTALVRRLILEEEKWQAEQEEEKR